MKAEELFEVIGAKEASMLLYWACRTNRVEIVDLLLKTSRVDVNKEVRPSDHPYPNTREDLIGDAVLHIACEKGYTNVVKRLLEQQDIKVNLEGRYQHTALHYASREGHIDVAKLLLQHPKIQIDALDNQGVTPSIRASIVKNYEIVELLSAHQVLEESIDTDALESNTTESFRSLRF